MVRLKQDVSHVEIETIEHDGDAEEAVRVGLKQDVSHVEIETARRPPARIPPPGRVLNKTSHMLRLKPLGHCWP